MITSDSHKNEIKVRRFEEINIKEDFFDSIRRVYAPYYDIWLEKTRDHEVYTIEENGKLVGFLKLKIEEIGEDYSDISPMLSPKKRMKISSLKVAQSGRGLGRALMEFALNKAIWDRTEEIYGTVVKDCEYYNGLKVFLEKWGFEVVGIKKSHGLEEDVFLRSIQI